MRTALANTALPEDLRVILPRGTARRLAPHLSRLISMANIKEVGIANALQPKIGGALRFHMSEDEDGQLPSGGRKNWSYAEWMR